jgi:hypothetical protein
VLEAHHPNVQTVYVIIQNFNTNQGDTIEAEIITMLTTETQHRGDWTGIANQDAITMATIRCTISRTATTVTTCSQVTLNLTTLFPV